MMLSAFWPFYQFIWTVFFFTMMMAGFWCIMMFATFIVPLWLTQGLAEYFGKTKPFDPEEVRYKKLYEQEGVEVIYQKAVSQASEASSTALH
ncbi:hypothetical protein [Riemerella columbina]|uniref:hypothetical protein n=1 Tax=Riemerella columbina TaxID=103810 RepID=UPI0003A36964|nr:hypothetical protein [Riemerella columbina]